MGSDRYLTYDMLREGLYEALRRPPHARWLATSEAYMLHSGRGSWLLCLDPRLDITAEVQYAWLLAVWPYLLMEKVYLRCHVEAL